MSHLSSGLLGTYNSLTDKHLVGYFNNTRIRRHLEKVGLISRSGRIVPEKEYRHKLLQRSHQRHVRECLAQAIFHKVLDMERLHQIDIKRKLEEFERRERVHKIKVERSNRYEGEEPVMMLSPRPPTVPKNLHTQHSGPDGENWESTESAGSTRPNTAPGKIQRPVRLKPLHSNSTSGSVKRNQSHFRHQDTANDIDQPFSAAVDRELTRHLALADFSCSVSPYRLPVINNFVTPVPPLNKRKDRGPKGNGTLWGRRLRPTTAPDAAPTAVPKGGAVQRESARSVVSVRMVYLGKSVHLSHDLTDVEDEVKVFQQHCGGENLCVYRGRLTEGETFQFVSRRHRGFPFSLTFFLNGLQVERLSSCCEFKHRKGSRLGGRHGHFGFFGVEGASPCYRCIIAMGLDKKPVPPKRVKEEALISKPQKISKEEHEEKDPKAQEDSERDTCREDKAKNDYEEDFEADDEGPVEDETSSTPSRKKEENKDEDEVTEKNREPDNEAEDLDKKRVKRSPSISSGLSSSSLESEEDKSERVIEPDDEDHVPAVTEDQIPEDTTRPERLVATQMSDKDTRKDSLEGTTTSSVTLPQPEEEKEDTEIQACPADTTESSGMQASEDPAKDDGERTGLGERPARRQSFDESKEAEPERAKSVQEKVTTAMLEAAECCSEPELSDTTTEEDEVASVRTSQDNQGAEAEERGAGTTEARHELQAQGCAEDSAQPESEPTEGENEAKQEAEQEEQPAGGKPKDVAEEGEIEEQPAGGKPKDVAEGGETEEQPETDHKEMKEGLEQTAAYASEEPEMSGRPDDEKTGELEGSKAVEMLATEAEAKSGNGAGGTVGVVEPQTEEEPREAITEPPFEEPGEKTADDKNNMGEAKKPNCHSEMKQSEAEEAGSVGRVGDETSEDEDKKKIRAEGEETVDDEEDEEKPREDKANAEERGEEIMGRLEERRGSSVDDREMKAQEEGEEKEEVVTGHLQDSAQEQLSEVSGTNLEVIGGKKESSKERHVEDDVERHVEGNVERHVEGDVERHVEGDVERHVEGDVERHVEGDVERHVEGDVERHVEGDVERHVEGDVERGLEQTHDHELRDTQSTAEIEAEDVGNPADSSKDADCSEENVKESESKEVGTEDGEKQETEANNPDMEFERREAIKNPDQEGESGNPEDNSRNHGAEVCGEGRVGVAERGGEESAAASGGADEVEVIEGVEGDSTVDQDSGMEGVEAGVEVAELEEKNESETRGHPNETQRSLKVSTEPTTGDSANQERAESNVEVSESENKPEKQAEESGGERETEPTTEKDTQAEDEGKFGDDNKEKCNDEPEEDVKQSESVKEAEGGQTEERGEHGDMDGKEGEELKGTARGSEAEIQEGVEGDKKEENNKKKDHSDPSMSEGQGRTDDSEAGAGREELEGEEKAVDGNHTEVTEQEEALLDRNGETDQAEIKQDTSNEDVVKDDLYNGEKEESEVGNDSVEASLRCAESAEPADAGSEPKPVACVTGEDGRHESPAIEESSEWKRGGAPGGSAQGGDTEAPPTAPPTSQSDLVSNWVNIHQASRYFETFIEPMEDTKSLGSPEGMQRVNGEALEAEETQNPSRSAKHEHIDMPPQNEHQDVAAALMEIIKMETKNEALEPEASSSQSTDPAARRTQHFWAGTEGHGVDEMSANTQQESGQILL